MRQGNTGAVEPQRHNEHNESQIKPERITFKPYFFCAFAPLREIKIRNVSRKGAKAQKKMEYL
ncbi:hypothetical protein PLANPX_1841 [Lacipirellula parvula]|uniref:Uncharacterized protein n=1 Tax=Lacipirellula parvula TaxID=2650471 RepID=A0A5K7XGZ3_9BACT|nr:hypothetical protein PLANPX_1841 [Lacipirellula parvula]